jgi:RNA 3'-terminal phosphate cyclase
MQGKNDYLTVVHGSYGQRRGRILRTFLALSAIHQKPAAIHHIRANRNHPGFDPQPLRGLEALAHITVAKIDGVRKDSKTVHTAFQ